MYYRTENSIYNLNKFQQIFMAENHYASGQMYEIVGIIDDTRFSLYMSRDEKSTNVELNYMYSLLTKGSAEREYGQTV